MREEKALHFLCRDCCNDIPKLTPEDDEVISSVSNFLLLLERKKKRIFNLQIFCVYEFSAYNKNNGLLIKRCGCETSERKHARQMK